MVDYFSKGGEKGLQVIHKLIDFKSFCKGKIEDKMGKYIKK